VTRVRLTGSRRSATAAARTRRDRGWTTGAVRADEILRGLAERGAVAQNDSGAYFLTDAGEAERAAVSECVRSLRMSMTDGLDRAEYDATVDAPRLMAENLERRPELTAFSQPA